MILNYLLVGLIVATIYAYKEREELRFDVFTCVAFLVVVLAFPLYIIKELFF